jgi:hypothetical protein
LASTDCPGNTSVGLRFRERLGEYRSGAKLQRYSPAERGGLEVLMRSAQNAICNHAFRLSTVDEFFFPSDDVKLVATLGIRLPCKPCTCKYRAPHRTLAPTSGILLRRWPLTQPSAAILSRNKATMQKLVALRVANSTARPKLCINGNPHESNRIIAYVSWRLALVRHPHGSVLAAQLPTGRWLG